MDDSSYNPFDFWCPHLIDAVLQHLTIKELLVLSEVSPDFWSFISRYKKFRRNVVFTLNPSRKVKEKELVAIMVNLRRNYDSFAAVGSEVISSLQICAKHHTWKHVKLSKMVFNRPTLLQNFIDIVRSSVEEFVMSSVFIFNCDKQVMMSLPKTKSLEMFECNDQENTPIKRISFFISDCLDLKLLKLHFAGVSDENQKRLVQKNKNLKDLSLVDVRDDFFESFGNLTALRLQKLSVTFMESRAPSRLNFMKFLMTQTRSLKSLEVSGWASTELIAVAYSMPQLLSLKISNARIWFAKIDEEELYHRLQYNLSLQDLVLSEDLGQFQEVWMNLLYKAPCLDNFRMESPE